MGNCKYAGLKEVIIIILLLLPIGLCAQIENWVYRYNGPGNNDDEANSIVYGVDGNIYAAGYSNGSGTESDFTVISLASAGDTNWTYRYNGPGNNDDEANSIVYGADGNIYAAGYSYGSGTESDFTVISLASDGDTNWTYRYNGPGNFEDQVWSIIYGTDDNIYAAGYSTGYGTANDFTVISLTSTGDENWIYRYIGAGNSCDQAFSIVFGTDGNIYAAGASIGSGMVIYFTVISLTSIGDENWVYRYNRPGNSFDKANSIVFGADGNIYAAGVVGGITTADDFAVISLTSTGDENWVYSYNGAQFYPLDQAHSIVYGANGNIYAAGYSMGYGTLFDFIVISLTSTGHENWVYRYNGTGNSWDQASSIVYGADGNIYAAGYSTGTGGNYDFTVISIGYLDVGTISLDIADTLPEGTTHWPMATVVNYGPETETFDVACEIEPGGYSSSETVTNLAPNDSIQVTFSPDFTFASGSYTVTVYTQLAGDENPANDTLEKVIETYDPGIAEGNSDIPDLFSFEAPTISRGKTEIEFALPVATTVDLMVYDAVGRLSKIIVSRGFSAGIHTLHINLDLPAGVYFYKLRTASSENVIKKFLLIR